MNYQIDYILVDDIGTQIKEGTFNVKNQHTEFGAIAGLEKHLLKQYPKAKKLLAKKVRVETILGYMENPLNDFFNQFAGKK